MEALTNGVQSPLKRSLSSVDDQFHPSKKLKISYQRHHSLHHEPQSIPQSEPAFVEQETFDKLLIDAIRDVVLEKLAQKAVEQPVIESLALEALRNATEEFILGLCSLVRRSMLAARRTVPIPPDFEKAFDALELPWPDDQLQPYISKPATNPPLLPTPPPENPFELKHQLPASVLGPGLDGAEERRREHYIPAALPPFPSQHTYKDTAVYPTRERDPRRIRELAGEEGKRGEDNLGKLEKALKASNVITAAPDVGVQDDSKSMGRWRKPKHAESSIGSMFEETMRDLLKEGQNGDDDQFELSPIVNCEKRYMMQEAASAGTRSVRKVAFSTGASEGNSTTALSAKARGKQKADGESVVDVMEI